MNDRHSSRFPSGAESFIEDPLYSNYELLVFQIMGVPFDQPDRNAGIHRGAIVAVLDLDQNVSAEAW